MVNLVWDDIQTKMQLPEGLKEQCDVLAEKCLELVKDVYNMNSEIDISLVDNEQIRDINMAQREIDRPTDVLSFPMNMMMDGFLADDEMFSVDPDTHDVILGDIVISLEKCAEQAEEYGHSFEREFLFLLSHGVFHLLGFDHMEAEEEKVMIGMQEAVLEEMGYSREK